ncbi:hypothetical protein M153_17200014773 [Pseudoloma neurophilia]|uniref:Uncharacterized protein n=1 Tax=Pseudoloma neurophilia TaxID=146866 RepID=A0A0R0M3I5_9MICR|nr:hypothetical protein M153_17200014773 [Pseudoloma neurophilia]
MKKIINPKERQNTPKWRIALNHCLFLGLGFFLFFLPLFLMSNHTNDQISSYIIQKCFKYNEKCDNCGSLMRIKSKKEDLLICRRKPCSNYKSIFKNTIIEHFKKN